MHKVDGTKYAVLKMHNCHESDVVLHDTVCSHMFFYNSTHSLSTVAGTGGAGGARKSLHVWCQSCIRCIGCQVTRMRSSARTDVRAARNVL